MLHPYQIVSKRRVLYTGLSEEPAPEMELLALLCSIDVWLDGAGRLRLGRRKNGLYPL